MQSWTTQRLLTHLDVPLEDLHHRGCGRLRNAELRNDVVEFGVASGPERVAVQEVEAVLLERALARLVAHQDRVVLGVRIA